MLKINQETSKQTSDCLELRMRTVLTIHWLEGIILVIGMFSNWILMIAAHYKLVKYYWIVCLQWVNFIVFKLYFNKSVFKNFSNPGNILDQGRGVRITARVQLTRPDNGLGISFGGCYTSEAFTTSRRCWLAIGWMDLESRQDLSRGLKMNNLTISSQES